MDSNLDHSMVHIVDNYINYFTDSVDYLFMILTFDLDDKHIYDKYLYVFD